MQRHAHNWAITTECFNSFRSLKDFWNVLAVDDGLAQGYAENEGKEFKEFVCTMGLGFGWLRAVARGSSFNKIELGSNFGNK